MHKAAHGHLRTWPECLTRVHLGPIGPQCLPISYRQYLMRVLVYIYIYIYMYTYIHI